MRDIKYLYINGKRVASMARTWEDLQRVLAGQPFTQSMAGVVYR